MVDVGAYVLAKLKNKAKELGSHSKLYSSFCQEEFLRKLSLSKYADEDSSENMGQRYVCR